MANNSSSENTPKLMVSQADKKLLKLGNGPYVNAAIASAIREKQKISKSPRLESKNHVISPYYREKKMGYLSNSFSNPGEIARKSSSISDFLIIQGCEEVPEIEK